MKHLMIDLETLSTASNAVVTQLGWAVFDDEVVDDVLSFGLLHFDVETQIKAGLKVDWSTIAWWLDQDRAAQQSLLNQARLLPSEALDNFTNSTYGSHNISAVWSHGACFDIIIMENLFNKASRKIPWDFRSIRDTRTLFDLAKPSLVWAQNEIKHNAMYDACAQAKTVQRAMKIVKGKTCTPSLPETLTKPSLSESPTSENMVSNEIRATVPS